MRSSVSAFATEDRSVGQRSSWSWKADRMRNPSPPRQVNDVGPLPTTKGTQRPVVVARLTASAYTCDTFDGRVFV